MRPSTIVVAARRSYETRATPTQRRAAIEYRRCDDGLAASRFMSPLSMDVPRSLGKRSIRQRAHEIAQCLTSDEGRCESTRQRIID